MTLPHERLDNGMDWSFEAPAWSNTGLVNLVEGASFCVAGRSADIHADSPQGLFFLDTRLISRFELSLDEHPVEPLTVVIERPFSATHIGRRLPEPGAGGDVPVIVIRRRHVGRGMRDDIELRNYGHRPISTNVRLSIESDFANVFAVKDGRSRPRHTRPADTTDHGMRFSHVRSGRQVSIEFAPRPHVLTPGVAEWMVQLDGGESWSLCTEVALWLDGERIPPSHPCDVPVEESVPAERLATWTRSAPRVSSNLPSLALGVRQAAEDLGALRIFDPDHPRRVVVAAGAPWFMTLFGRDSLLTAWMALIVDPSLAEGVLETLADFQGTHVDPSTEEQPGRILHEVRFGESASLSLGGGNVYYGTVDATPLFVMMLGELGCWGLAEEVIDRLRPNLDRALAWIDAYGDLDGDGYVEYQRLNPAGLLHQGWKDSWDSVRFLDGGHADPPIALCEVQGYVYAAFLAAARLALRAGEAERAARFRRRAADLKSAFNRDFWLEDRGWYAMGLDHEKRPIDALASNLGHCLWTGIVDDEHADAVADRLLSPDVFTGWGIRTLAASSAAYNPVSYHCGSVWPHDTAIAAAGLMRYGFVDEAHRLMLGLLDLADAMGGRLPELIAGFSRTEFPTPVPYPTSCSPQAWAAATPLLILRTLLRFDPAVPMGKLFMDPALPDEIRRLHVDHVPLADARLTIAVEDGEIDVSGLPEDVVLVHGTRSGHDMFP